MKLVREAKFALGVLEDSGSCPPVGIMGSVSGGGATMEMARNGNADGKQYANNPRFPQD
jgi:hypothetical protein